MCEYKIVIGSQEAGRRSTHDYKAWACLLDDHASHVILTLNCVLHYTGLMRE